MTLERMTETRDEDHTSQNDVYSRIYIVISDIMNSPLYHHTQYYARRHPMLAVAALTIGFLSFLPLLTFTLFVLATFLVSLLWFLVVEGAVLTVGIVILSGTLFTIGIFGAVFTGSIAVSWYIVQKIHRIACFHQNTFNFSDYLSGNKTHVKQEAETITPINSKCDSEENTNG